MLSDNTDTILQYTPLSQHTLHLRIDFQYKVAPFSQFIPTASCNGFHPTPGDNHKSTGGLSESTQGQAKMAG